MISCTNLVVRKRFGDGPVVALNAHGDVVPPGEGWTHDPFGAEIVDGWMYGRGVAVSKSRLRHLRLRAAGPAGGRGRGSELGGTVELHLTYDEEVRRRDRAALADRVRASAIPTSPSAPASPTPWSTRTMAACIWRCRSTAARRTPRCRSPASTRWRPRPTSSRHLYAWRKTLAERRSDIEGIGSPQLTIGLIKGGINTNVVPDRVTFRLDRRMVPEEFSEAVEAELTQVIGDAAKAFPEAKVTVRRILLARPLVPLAGGQRLTEILCRRATAIMGEPVAAKGVPLYTDARHYAEKGIPIVLYGAGPHTIQEANAHRADERLPLADLHKATEVVALSLLDLLTPT